MFWTPYHLQQFESIIEKLNNIEENEKLYLNPVQAVSIREILKYDAFNKGVKFANIVEETKEVFDDNTYKIYEDVSPNVENGLTVKWNEEQINIVIYFIQTELKKHSLSWNEYKKDEKNQQIMKRSAILDKAFEKARQTNEAVKIEFED